mmetsp:Transcript_27379/g.49294  ORF Transcript_27379/g.49294 Transcript_27379/m.49294 type:complete len:83 (+) Transcript_27379:1764-2012(+)
MVGSASRNTQPKSPQASRSRYFSPDLSCPNPNLTPASLTPTKSPNQGMGFRPRNGSSPTPQDHVHSATPLASSLRCSSEERA